MTKRIILIILTFFTLNNLRGQIIIFPIGIGYVVGAAIMPEHGFLSGKKFKFYPTIDKYDFTGLKLRIEIYDERENLKLTKTQCSDIEFTNSSEFSNPNCIFKVSKYLDTLFKQSGAIIDSASTDTLQIWFEGIDARLIGFGHIRAHGLCQMKIKYHNITKTYCIDITDADKHSPISPTAFVTRKTATRIIASASIREVIEQFFVDLKTYK
jgi:hypothetical protein